MNRLSALPKAGCALMICAALGFGATKVVDLKRDVRAAKLLVTGEISRVYSYYGTDGDIYSDITLNVTSVLKQDTETPSSIQFTIPGGVVGDEGVLYTSSPQFELNEAALVFLEANDRGGVDATAKYELDGRFLHEVKMDALKLIERVSEELKAIGEPAREYELQRAMAFVKTSRKGGGEPETILNAGDATCFRLTGPKWRIPSVTFKFDSTLPAGFAQALLSASSQYNNANVAIRLSQSNFSTNVINYGVINGQGTLAQARVSYQPATNTIVGFTITYNRTFQWSTTGEAGKYDVEGVGAHELGHAVGLNHPDPAMCSDQTMWYSAAPGETSKRVLKVGDLAGLSALYGAAPVVSAPMPSTPPPPSGPTTNPGQAPPIPVLTSMTASGTLSSNSPITLNAVGTAFTTNGLQFVIRGAGCSALTGCVIDFPLLQNLTGTTARAIFTPRGSGAYTVTLRNTAQGSPSANSFRFNVALAMRR